MKFIISLLVFVNIQNGYAFDPTKSLLFKDKSPPVNNNAPVPAPLQPRAMSDSASKFNVTRPAQPGSSGPPKTPASDTIRNFIKDREAKKDAFFKKTSSGTGGSMVLKKEDGNNEVKSTGVRANHDNQVIESTHTSIKNTNKIRKEDGTAMDVLDKKEEGKDHEKEMYLKQFGKNDETSKDASKGESKKSGSGLSIGGK